MSDITEQEPIQIDACWNRIGVWSKSSERCPKLAEVIHCRNCETYSAAGRLVLDRRLPDAYEKSWAEIYAQNKQEKIAGTESITIFRLGDEWLALPTNIIQEVTEVRIVHSVPHRKNPVLRGLVNLRGQLRICVSLGQLLHIEKATENTPEKQRLRTYERMVAIRKENDAYVFLVSEVKGTYRYRPDELQDPPATLAHSTNTFTRGIIRWEDHDVACLDSELMFYNLERNLA